MNKLTEREFNILAYGSIYFDCRNTIIKKEKSRTIYHNIVRSVQYNSDSNIMLFDAINRLKELLNI